MPSVNTEAVLLFWKSSVDFLFGLRHSEVLWKYFKIEISIWEHNPMEIGVFRSQFHSSGIRGNTFPFSTVL